MKNYNNTMIDVHGDKRYYLNGKRHRIDGPAVEYIDGTKKWFVNNKLHRLDGPALESRNGDEEWWVNGKLHREDGPAIIYKMSNIIEYYIYGEELEKIEYYYLTKSEFKYKYDI